MFQASSHQDDFLRMNTKQECIISLTIRNLASSTIEVFVVFENQPLPPVINKQSFCRGSEMMEKSQYLEIP